MNTASSSAKNSSGSPNLAEENTVFGNKSYVMIDQSELAELLEAKKMLYIQKQAQAKFIQASKQSTDYISQAFSDSLFSTPIKDG